MSSIGLAYRGLTPVTTACKYLPGVLFSKRALLQDLLQRARAELHLDEQRSHFAESSSVASWLYLLIFTTRNSSDMVSHACTPVSQTTLHAGSQGSCAFGWRTRYTQCLAPLLQILQREAVHGQAAACTCICRLRGSVALPEEACTAF